MEFDSDVIDLTNWNLQSKLINETLPDNGVFNTESYFWEPHLNNGVFNTVIYVNSDTLAYPDSGSIIYFQFLPIGNLGDSSIIKLNWLQIEEQQMTNLVSKTIILHDEWLANDNDKQIFLPDKYKLNQNYPNPFNPITNITYSIPQLEVVKLTIFNIRGQVIKTLVHKSHSPGNYNVIWNGTNNFGNPIPAGIYLYALETHSHRLVKKLVLLK